MVQVAGSRAAMRHDVPATRKLVPDVVELERALHRLRHALDEVEALLDQLMEGTAATVYLDRSVWLGSTKHTAAGTSD